MDQAEPDSGPPDVTVGGALPRRSQQEHLEPQLRVAGGGGDGTPFAAFTAASDQAAGPDAAGPGDGTTAAARAAAFRRRTGRGGGPA